ALQQPDKVKMVLDKIRTDGLLPTLDAVRNKLDQPLPIGYCNAGVVAELGAGVDGFAIGDRVVSNGKHAEMVCVPVNLCARIPDRVTDDVAAFTVVGAVGLQGVRLVQPALGEAVVVTGLGVTGLDLARADFYEKELSFQVSCSYGPGRYDPAYEEGGQDYPVGFVRWTAQRNFEAVLDMMATGRLDANSLISHRFKLEQTRQAYAVVAGSEPSLGILLEYPTLEQQSNAALRVSRVHLPPSARGRSTSSAPA